MDDSIPKLSALLAERDDLVLALLFGSRAAGTARPDSDVDLALLGRGPLGTDVKLEVMRRVGAAFGTAVDVVDLHGTPEPVTGEALAGVRLLGDDRTFAELLIRHLDNVEDFIPLQRRILDERRERWLR